MTVKEWKMNDLISRRDAIDLLSGYTQKNKLGHTPLDIVKHLPSVQLQHWIPCAERLPDKEGRYLCSVGSHYRTQREMIYAPETWKHDDCNLWRSTDGAYCHNRFVEAWMPFPEPYKGENR